MVADREGFNLWAPIAYLFLRSAVGWFGVAKKRGTEGTRLRIFGFNAAVGSRRGTN